MRVFMVRRVILLSDGKNVTDGLKDCLSYVTVRILFVTISFFGLEIGMISIFVIFEGV
jgi:hypothetical protein